MYSTPKKFSLLSLHQIPWHLSVGDRKAQKDGLIHWWYPGHLEYRILLVIILKNMSEISPLPQFFILAKLDISLCVWVHSLLGLQPEKTSQRNLTLTLAVWYLNWIRAMGMGRFALSTKVGSQVRIIYKNGHIIWVWSKLTACKPPHKRHISLATWGVARSLVCAKTQKSPLVLSNHSLLG
jgi:hypothetical protein